VIASPPRFETAVPRWRCYTARLTQCGRLSSLLLNAVYKYFTSQRVVNPGKSGQTQVLTRE